MHNKLKCWAATAIRGLFVVAPAMLTTPAFAAVPGGLRGEHVALLVPLALLFAFLVAEVWWMTSRRKAPARRPAKRRPQDERRQPPFPQG